MTPLTVDCASRSGRPLARSLELRPAGKDREDQEPTLSDLKAAYEKRYALPACRQRWTYNGVTLEERKSLVSGYGIKNNDTLVLKDLGPQVAWRTVFLVEYAGPIFIYPLIYHGYYGSTPKLLTQQLAYVCLMAHFIKRELETVFVHRFSHSTMPASNLVKNSTHYWLVSGLLVAWDVFAPQKAGSTESQSLLATAIAVALFIFAQLSNLKTHLILRALRPAGSTTRKIPRGYGFDLVSCPNYFFETLSWLAIFLLTQSWSVLLFLIISVMQMYAWARKKHVAYRKEFGSAYPASRKAMFPYIA